MYLLCICMLLSKFGKSIGKDIWLIDAYIVVEVPKQGGVNSVPLLLLLLPLHLLHGFFLNLVLLRFNAWPGGFRDRKRR